MGGGTGTGFAGEAKRADVNFYRIKGQQPVLFSAVVCNSDNSSQTGVYDRATLGGKLLTFLSNEEVTGVHLRSITHKHPDYEEVDNALLEQLGIMFGKKGIDAKVVQTSSTKYLA